MAGIDWMMATAGGVSDDPLGKTALSVVIAIISTGLITTIVTSWVNRRKTAAETSGLVVDTYSQMLGDMRALMDGTNQRLELSLARIAKLERTEQLQRRRIAQLESALAQANIAIPEDQEG